MPDSAPTPVTPAAAPHTRGYFNKSQLEDLGLAESVLNAARDNATDLLDWDITTAYLDGLDTVITETRRRASESGQTVEDSHSATDLTSAAATALYIALQSIQSSAK